MNSNNYLLQKMTELEFKIKKPGNIRDKEVIAQLPTDIVEQLGDLQETGYDLRLSRRDMFYVGGMVVYWPYKTACQVTLESSKTDPK